MAKKGVIKYKALLKKWMDEMVRFQLDGKIKSVELQNAAHGKDIMMIWVYRHDTPVSDMIFVPMSNKDSDLEKPKAEYTNLLSKIKRGY